jgi:type IV pilus assembly protein PilO
MNMTARDKKLLTGLGIFIALVLFGRFIIYPKLDRIAALKSDIAGLNNNYATNMIYKAKAGNIDSNIKILSVKLKDLRTAYPPKITISELIMEVKNLSTQAKLDVKSLDFQPYKAVSFSENKGNASGQNQTNTANGADSKSGAQPAAAPDSGNSGQQQGAGADNITNPKILNYFYMWGLKGANKNDKNDTDEAAINIPDGKGYSVSVKIEAEGTNEQIKAFFAGLEKLDVKAYCKTASISKAANAKAAGDIARAAVNTVSDDKKLKLSAEIAFYGIMDKAAGGYYLLQDGKWNPIASARDKQDLFSQYSGYEEISTQASTGSDSGKPSTSNVGTVGSDDKKSEEVKSDFYVVASAFGGGYAPSVSIGCNNPNRDEVLSMPVVYGDNKGIENAEIYIEKRDGRFYCKFKTDHESYPDDKYSKTFEFLPEGKELKIDILSSTRSAEEDKAGVNLNIINKTDLDLTYQIKFDDEKSPRVKIGKTVGSVRYEK